MSNRSRRRPSSGTGRDNAKSLRQRALDLLDKDSRQAGQIPEQDLKTLLHELQVHQVELEMQNQELRESRQALEQTQAEYASLYDHAPVGYLSLDQRGRIRKLNLLAAAMLGRPRTELSGRSLARFIVDADRPAFLRESRLALAGADRRVCELRIRRAGESVHVHFEYQPASPEEDKAPLLLVTMTDISQRVRMEEELQLNRRQLEVALQASRCGLWYWPDMDRDETWWSPEHYRLLGYEDGAIRPGFDTFKALLHPADRDRVIQELESKALKGEAFDTEFRLRTRSGDYHWFRNQSQIIHGSRGNRYMAGLLQDITDRRELDHALRQAKEKAEGADREKSRFLAAASHDLRQPLQSLSLYLGTLKHTDLVAEQTELVGKMRQSVHTMGLLLRTLLNISRLDAGVITPELVSFPVRNLFDDVLVTCEPIAAVRGLELRVHACNSRLYSDRILLQEILQNFITNALGNADRGGVLLGCRRRGDKALIQVWDTGIGIPPEKLQALLSPAAESAPVPDHRHGGTVRTGLGLSIVQQIAGLLDCRVTAASVPGRGSLFTIEVPLAGAGSHAAEVRTEDEVGAEAAVRDGQNILLVDNDAAILDACRGAAAAGGYRLATASSRKEALERLAEGFIPDIIVCDLQLRRATGTVTIQELRAALGRNIPAILLTGDTSNLDAEARTLGRCRVLFKPVEFEFITHTAKEMLTG